MPGDSISGLAMGLAMFLLTVTTVLWRKFGRKRAAEDLPKLAADLQLEFVPPRYATSQGRLEGRYEDHEVRIDPEESCTIQVRFNGSPEIDLRTYEHPVRARSGWEPFYSGDRTFDRYFKTRLAGDELAASLRGSDNPSQYIEAFRGAFESRIQSLIVTSDGVKCQLDFGKPPYIPAEAIRALLPCCIALVRFIESKQAQLSASESGSAPAESPLTPGRA